MNSGMIRAWILLLAAWPLAAYPAERIDGNAWLATPEGSRRSFMIGFLEGMDAQASSCHFGFTQFPFGDKKPLPVDLLPYENSVCELGLKFGQANTNQLAEGLTAFYGDYKNRLILVAHALAIVNDEVHGNAREAANLTRFWRLQDGKN